MYYTDVIPAFYFIFYRVQIKDVTASLKVALKVLFNITIILGN